MYLTLALAVLGVMSLSAQERISLQEVPFTTWNGYGSEASKGDAADFAWVVGESTGMPYGDGSVINGADLSLYSKLYITYTEGKPRVMLNRDVQDGQWNADEAASRLIEYPKDGWSSKYFTDADGVLIVDLKQIMKDKGYVRLHAIKGANWQNVTVTSMEVEKQGKAQQVGWTSVITNGNMEGDDVSSFPVALNAVVDQDVHDATIEEGVGVDGSRALTISSMAGASESWATQLFVKASESLPEGTKWRFSMQAKADRDATVATGAHALPRQWKAGGIIPEFTITTDWTTITAEGVVDADLGSKNFQSIAFDLNADKENENKFYFDNIAFEVFKYGTTAEFSNDVVLIDFGFDTNLGALVKASGKPRLMYPKECVSVKVNGQVVDLYSVEGFQDGRFYIFLDQAALENDQVLVSFTNPADEALHLVYTSGPGGDVTSATDVEATLNSEIEDNEGYPYDYLTPVIVSADPEDGSFNLPNSIKEFKLVFDKPVDCAALTATINGQPLTVSPATEFSENITLVRQGDADLANGEYTINVTKIYPVMRLDDTVFGDSTFVVNVGKAEYDPDDVPAEMLPDYFAATNSNNIPEGYIVDFNGEQRLAGSGYGSGPRMFDFAAGGDFTKGLYFREGYVEYGSLEGYQLTLTEGKKYQIHFNSAMWKDNGSKLRFEIFNSDMEQVLVRVIDNKPNVNGATSAVNGSTSTDIKFFPAATGNYILRWTSAGNETDGPAFMEIVLANPKVTYIPNQVGIEETQLLNTALANAKEVRDGNADERYSGAAYDALVAAIEKYEAEKDHYTAPSVFRKAAADLDALAQAMKDHRALCDSYDTQIKKAIDVVRQNAENKFAATALYADLTAIVDKYHGTSEWVDIADHSGETEENPVEPVWQLNYNFDILKDDVALDAAVKELTDIANTSSLLFTEGVSAPENANGGKATGVAVLIDRLRLGAEDLKALGVGEDDELVVAAKNALTDDDKLAEKIQARLKEIIYGKLKDGNDLFAPIVDEATLEETTPEYDLSVFVKNPNTYKQLPNMDFTEENVPGWTTPEGFNKPGLTVGWGQPKNVEGIAEDCMFQTWGGTYRVEQTLVDLPAGVYSIVMGFGERNGESDLPGSFIYAKTSETPIAEEGEEEQFAAVTEASVIGQSFPFLNTRIDNVLVTDGILTIGVNAGPTSHTFFNDVRVILTAPATGFDYAAAYNEVVEYITEGIDQAQTQSVRAIEFYNLDGRRIDSARHGVVIVKKYMSDGTVKTEKVVRK